MKLQRPALAAGLLASALALAACGSDDNTEPTAQSTGSSGGDATACASGALQAAGSSAQLPAVNAWIEAFQNQCADAAVNYDGQGSGVGITQFTQGQIPLAGSDAFLADGEQGPADTRCAGGRAIDLPMVATPVAFVYNVQGLDKLNLTPEILAKVYTGGITRWNDPEIAAANQGADLPSTTITTVHRAGDSGTTDNFTRFLDAQAKDHWTFGTGKGWKAPGGVGGKDSSAVVRQVKTTDGAIGYVDGPDATKNKLTTATLDTGSGPVAISADSVGRALSAARTAVDGQDIKVDINYALKQADTYPAILVTYEITCTRGLPDDQAELVKSFLTLTSGTAGQGMLSGIGHLPLPTDLLAKVRDSVSQLP